MTRDETPVTYLFVPGRPARALRQGAGFRRRRGRCSISRMRWRRADKDAGAAAHPCSGSMQHPDERATHRRAHQRCATSGGSRPTSTLLRDGGIDGVMLPKAESRGAGGRGHRGAAGRRAACCRSSRPRAASRTSTAIAAAPGVLRLVFGTLDYGVDLDLSGDERGLVYPSAADRDRLALRRASRRRSPASRRRSTTRRGCCADLAFARAFGFGAKLCIHPRQVGVIRDAMRPTDAEIEWARRVVAAAEGGAAKARVQVDGRMVDRPVILKARPCSIARAEASSRRPPGQFNGHRQGSPPWAPPSSTPGSSATSSAPRRCAEIWSDENRTAKYLEIERALAMVQGRLGIIPQDAADEIVRNCDIAKIDMEKLRTADRADRLPGARRRLAAQRAVPRTSSASTATGARRRRTSPTRRRSCRSARALALVEADLAALSAALARTSAGAPRYAGRGPQQSAAGDPGHVRLQDGDDPGRRRAASRAARRSCGRACWSANSAARAARWRRSRRARWRRRPG